MKRSFFAFMDAAELTLFRKYPDHTDMFERVADNCESLFKHSIPDPTPSELLVQMLFRINLNYLIGAYKATLQTINSFAFSGMRNVFEGIVRGYYYLGNEEAAIASYLYMCTDGGKKAPSFEDLDVDIMKRIIGQVQDVELKQLCDKVLKKKVFSEEDITAVSKLDESSRKIKHNIGKLYARARRKHTHWVYRSIFFPLFHSFKVRKAFLDVFYRTLNGCF